MDYLNRQAIDTFVDPERKADPEAKCRRITAFTIAMTLYVGLMVVMFGYYVFFPSVVSRQIKNPTDAEIAELFVEMDNEWIFELECPCAGTVTTMEGLDELDENCMYDSWYSLSFCLEAIGSDLVYADSICDEEGSFTVQDELCIQFALSLLGEWEAATLTLTSFVPQSDLDYMLFELYQRTCVSLMYNTMSFLSYNMIISTLSTAPDIESWISAMEGCDEETDPSCSSGLSGIDAICLLSLPEEDFITYYENALRVISENHASICSSAACTYFAPGGYEEAALITFAYNSTILSACVGLMGFLLAICDRPGGDSQPKQTGLGSNRVEPEAVALDQMGAKAADNAGEQAGTKLKSKRTSTKRKS